MTTGKKNVSRKTSRKEAIRVRREDNIKTDLKKERNGV